MQLESITVPHMSDADYYHRLSLTMMGRINILIIVNGRIYITLFADYWSIKNGLLSFAAGDEDSSVYDIEL